LHFIIFSTIANKKNSIIPTLSGQTKTLTFCSLFGRKRNTLVSGSPTLIKTWQQITLLHATWLG